MNITLIKSGIDDANTIHQMQVQAFTPLLHKYLDYETSPANETVDRIVERINQSFTDYYIIKESNTPVGAIRVVRRDNNRFRVSPIFILPQFQGKGIAQFVFELIENHYKEAKVWELDTILQEKGNCYLYEKLGYTKTGKKVEINQLMTLVYYQKEMT